MRIQKYKYLKNNIYEVEIDDTKYKIYEDVILNNNILLKKELTSKELDNILNENVYYEAYYLSIKYISIRNRIDKEIYEYLTKKNIKKETINKVIERLKKDGYINELKYTKAYINDQINLKNNGPLKIKKELIQLGINEKVIDNELNIFTKDLINKKVTNIINKEVILNKNKSQFLLKNKINQKLIDLGYDKKDYIDILNSIDINEKEIYTKEYQKIYNKLSKKYDGTELEIKVKQKMYSLGFRT